MISIDALTPEQRRAYEIASQALHNVDDQLRKVQHLPLLAFQRGVVFAVMMNALLGVIN